ncbi:hypothetical protein BSLG_007278 [Batrachochytrium salamandrivorans]|nr:hypothetical protein BSLG_007278 [Batrachochytrium salamandrivorans]
MDDNRFVSTALFGTTFELPPRYTELEAIGMGSFGLVCSALDTVSNERRAIKKVTRPFQAPVLAKRAFRELMLLKHLHHDNIIGLTDVILSPSKEDLAPEIMLTWQRYDKAVDVWSAGCILAEMINEVPLFAGKNHVDQFAQIVRILGSPPEHVVHAICSENTLKFVNALPQQNPVPFSQQFPNHDPLALDLLSQTLVWDTKERITAEIALRHPYFAAFYDPNEGPDVAVPFNWSFTEADISVDEWRSKTIKEVECYQLSGES